MVDRSNDKPNISAPVDFGVRFAGSKLFTQIFQDGMSLVEETAAYLDGDGRKDAKLLDRNATIIYASESMRLTTRLMQLASWLLLQRAVGEGEMTPEEALKEKHRANLGDVSHTTPDSAGKVLPKPLMNLIDRSIRLYERIVKLDRMIHDPAPKQGQSKNPLTDQLDRLNAAFKQHSGN